MPSFSDPGGMLNTDYYAEQREAYPCRGSRRHCCSKSGSRKWWNTYFIDLWKRTTPEQRICLAILKTVGEADISLLEQQSNLDTRTVRRTIQMLHRRDLV
jgi:hypothetical protein